MMSLRTQTLIADLRTEKDVVARFVSLEESITAAAIDMQWWKMPPGSTSGMGEEDRKWNWEELCRDARRSDYWEATGLQTPDGRIQGAIIYRVDAMSVQSVGDGSIYVDNLATAPWNRKRVTDDPEYGGVGAELLCQAVHHSHLLGFKGRVTLVSLPRAVEFYVGKGFVETEELIEGLPLYELPPDQARRWLGGKGLVGNG